MTERKSSFLYDDLLACGRSELFGPGNVQLPLPPMLMFAAGFRCQEHGVPNCDLDQIDRRARRFMGDGAAWNYISMQQAIADSGLEEGDVKNERKGLNLGSGDISTRILVAAADRSASTLRCTDRVVPDLIWLGNGAPPASARKCAELCGRASNVSDESICCFGIVTFYSAGTAANGLAAVGTPIR